MLLSLRLKRRSSGALGRALMGAALVVTLVAVMLALFPAVAEAQTETQTEGKSNSSVVVRPGDSLWSISEEQLGPEATPQRIVNAAAQIYALNRARIGPNPNLILVGQELLVPEVVGQPSRAEEPSAEPSTGATPAEPAKEPAQVSRTDRGAEGGTYRISRESVREATGKPANAPEPVGEPVGEPEMLPDAAGAAPVPAVGSLAQNDSPPSPLTSFVRIVRSKVASAASAVAESFAGVRTDRGQLLDLGILSLTGVVLVITLLLVSTRRVALGRKARRRELWFRETYGRPYIASFAYHLGSLGDRAEQDTRQEAQREAPRALGHQRRAALTGSADSSAPSIVGKAGTGGCTPKATRAKVRAVARNGLALGAHDPKVRRAPLRVHASMRAQKLRPRRRASRRPLPPGAV